MEYLQNLLLAICLTLLVILLPLLFVTTVLLFIVFVGLAWLWGVFICLVNLVKTIFGRGPLW